MAVEGRSLIEQADEAMARGEAREAASLLELASRRATDSSTLLRLATVLRSLGDMQGAAKAAAAAVELSPRNFIMLLLLGSLRESMGAMHAAERAYRRAVARAPLDLSFQPAVQRQLEHAQRRVDAVAQWRTALLNWDPQSALPGIAPDEENRLRQFRSNILDNLDAGPLSPPVFMIPRLPRRSYFEPSEFVGIEEVERATDAIRAEFEALLRSQPEGALARLATSHAGERDAHGSGSWSMIPLVRNGAVVPHFASLCPETVKVAARLEQPNLGLISPSLYFSVLQPHSRIEPHTGMTNARVIAHFPLVVPADCGFRVDGETREWEPGKALIFDDMQVHEAWNDSDEMRVVLIADLWRPELSATERSGVEQLMSCRDVEPAR